MNQYVRCVVNILPHIDYNYEVVQGTPTNGVSVIGDHHGNNKVGDYNISSSFNNITDKV